MLRATRTKATPCSKAPTAPRSSRASPPGWYEPERGHYYDPSVRFYVRSVVACVAVVLACGCGMSSAAKPASGIVGRVMIGPTCPVERPGQSCVRPYATNIKVLGAARHHPVMTFESTSDGRFRVALSPGRYILEDEKPGLPRLSPRAVTVHRSVFTRVVLMFDSGLR